MLASSGYSHYSARRLCRSQRFGFERRPSLGLWSSSARSQHHAHHTQLTRSGCQHRFPLAACNVHPLGARTLHSLFRPTGIFSSLPPNWLWRDQKLPRGFENFFPKGSKTPPSKGGGSSPSTAKNSKTGGGSGEQKSSKTNKGDSKSKAGTEKSTDKKSKFASGSGNSNDTQNSSSSIGAALALLLTLVALQSVVESGLGNGNGKEITWVDFYHLLEDKQQEIEKIVVVNKEMARVTLSPNSPGLSSSASNNFASRWESPSHQTNNEAVGHPEDTQAGWGTDATLQDSHSMRSSRTSKKPLVYHFYISSIEHFEEKLAKAQHELNTAPRDWLFVEYVSEGNRLVELIRLTPFVLMVLLIFFTFRLFASKFGVGGSGGGSDAGSRSIFSIGKSNAKKISKEDVNVTFADVAGCDQAKLEIKEFVDFLADSTKFTKLGAKIPKGALLCGPPGTGKTLLAKAVAGEAGVPFFSISGSDFLEMFVGVGPSRVRDLFKEARASAPCIVFIDEIDAVGRRRGRGRFSGGNDERENTLNQLLVEMDGFSPTTGIVVLAGTNRVDILDEALTRAGRFDRQIQVDKPDLSGRRDIFKVHLRGISLDGSIEDYAGRLAGLCPGFSGADIANICNEAAIVAARRKGETVIMEDFEKATDRIIGGMESNKIMSKEERSIVAHHEAGHAVAGWFLEHADPLMKVTIIPRTSGALGFAQYLPREVYLRTQAQIMDIVCMALAGRAAEEVFFGRVTTGASDDLRRVTQLVYLTIQEYGMNSKIGQLAFPKKDSNSPGDKPYSDATAESMDDEARRVVDDAYERTLLLIREKKEFVEKVANLLLEKETITHDDLTDLIGPRPFVADSQYDEFISSRRKVREESKDVIVEESSMEDESPTVTSGLAPGLA